MSETEQPQATELKPVTNEAPAEETKATTEAAEPAATNEPVEGGDAASAAEDALLTNVTPTIFAALSFIAFVLFVVGTPLPWLRNDIGNRIQVSLWSFDTELPGGGSSVLRVADFPCNKMKQYFRGAEAFSIITIFFAAVTVLVGVLARSRGTSAKPLGTVFAFLTFLSSLICWGIGVAAYRRDFCGQTTFDEARYRVYVGAGLFVGGWVVSAIAFAISLKDIKVPKALPEAAVNKLVATLFTIVSLAAFLFALISTPISVFSKWTSVNVESRYTIWNRYVYTNGVMTTKAYLTDHDCGVRHRFAKATQAFSIITIVTCLIAAGAGVAALRGIGGNKGLILTGLVATLTGVIASGLDLTIFYKQFCNSQSLDAQHYNRDAGLALMVTSFVIMAAVTLLAIFAAVLQLCSSKPEGGNASKGSFLYIFGTIVSIAFLVVAIATPVLSRETSATSWTQVQWWQVETRNGATYTTSDFTCQKTWQRLVGGASIIVAAIAISSFGAIIGVAQFSNGALQVPATAFGLLSAVLQLIAFALAIDAWRTTYCGVNLKKANFDYDIGFALVPAAFCITVIVSILNLVLKA